MILKRRDKPGFWTRMRELVSPRKGFTRGMEYFGKRMKRLPDSPHRIALGFACGVFASFSPLFGLHFFVAAGCAWLVRGNVLASLFGTVMGNPVSFPFISAASLSVGRWMLGRAGDDSGFDAVRESFSEAFRSIRGAIGNRFGYDDGAVGGLATFFHEVFLPYLIGGVSLGLLCALAFYFPLVPLARAWQNRRRRKLEGARWRGRGGEGGNV